MVASGSADVYYECGIHCWDIAAGVLILEEAGGVVLNPKGPYMHELCEIVQANVWHCITRSRYVCVAKL